MASKSLGLKYLLNFSVLESGVQAFSSSSQLEQSGLFVFTHLFESLKTVHTFVPMAIDANDAFVTARVKFPVTLSLVISH